MKKYMLPLVFLFFFASSMASAQTYNVKTVKSEVINDYLQIPDSSINYPIRGLCYVNQKYSGNEVEFWVLDAKGKLLYYNIVNLMKNDRTMYMDPEYVRYMKLQGTHSCKSKS